jgi:PAS domain S-box-containing protein
MSGESFKALYVDDDIALLDITRSFFERDPEMKMRTASSASLALEMLSSDDYDVVISDYQMPRTDGIEFLKGLRSQGNDIPFILFTGRGREDVAIEALNSGADFYLQKGGDYATQFTELRNIILKLARNGRTERSLNKSKERFRRLVEGSPVAMCISRDLEFIYVNPSYVRLFGFQSKEELFKHPLKERVTPESRVLMAGTMSRVARGLLIDPSFEAVGIQADGSKFSFLLTLTQIELDDGPANVAYITDVSKNMEL